MQIESQLPLFAVMVKSRHEKAVRDLLTAKGIETYLPLQRCFRLYGNRKRTVELPLFPTYLFARFDPHAPLPVLSIPGVFGIVSNRQEPLAVDEQEFEGIQALCRLGMDIEEWTHGAPGEQVVVVDGPLAGVTGVYTSMKSRGRLILSITLLKRSLAVEIEAASVRPIRTGVHSGGNLSESRCAAA